MDNMIGFNEIACTIIGFLFGLLVSWASRFPKDPESQIVRDMLAMLKKRGRKKPNSLPPSARRTDRAQVIREMIDILTDKERQINGKDLFFLLSDFQVHLWQVLIVIFKFMVWLTNYYLSKQKKRILLMN